VGFGEVSIARAARHAASFTERIRFDLQLTSAFPFRSFFAARRYPVVSIVQKEEF
jgi:hypothetical protein